MSKVTLSHDSDGRRIADLEVCVDVGHLNDSYLWLLAQCIESNPDPVDIKVNPTTMKVELEPGLEGLLNFLEDIRERVDKAEEEVKHTEPLDLEAERREPKDDYINRDEALENHWDQREHFKEGME